MKIYEEEFRNCKECGELFHAPMYYRFGDKYCGLCAQDEDLKDCDCESPSTGHFSNYCPVHNLVPYSNPDK